MGFGKAGGAEEVLMSLMSGVASCEDLAVVGVKNRHMEAEKLLRL